MRNCFLLLPKKKKVCASRKLGEANFHSSATLCAMRMIDSKEKGYEYCDDLKGFKSRRKRRDYKGWRRRCSSSAFSGYGRHPGR